MSNDIKDKPKVNTKGKSGNKKVKETKLDKTSETQSTFESPKVENESVDTTGKENFVSTTDSKDNSWKKGSNSIKTKSKKSRSSEKRGFEKKGWDSKMSNSPDLQKQSADSPIKYRFPDLVDPDTGVVTPSLLNSYVNIFPCGTHFSLFYDYWFNNEYLDKLEKMAICYNGSDSPVNSEYISNYFRGVADTVGVYVYLSSISLLVDRRTKGEFDSDDKFKSSIGVLADFFQPNSAKFRNELSLLKQSIESYYLPPDLLRIVEETYSPKFSKFAGIRTVELTGMVFPIHPMILCYTTNQSQFDMELYKQQEKELVSLFIDGFFWSDIKVDLEGLSLPRRSSDRVWNFVRNTRTCLEVNTKNSRGEYFGLHEIMKTCVPEYSLAGKLKDNYNVVNISEGGRFARINNSQNYIAKPYYSQQIIENVFSVYRNSSSMTEFFGSVNFGVSLIPPVEDAGTYVDNGSGGRSSQGSIYNLIFDQVCAYHQTRGEKADLSGEEILKFQFGYKYRSSRNNSDEGDVYFTKDTIQPGLMVKIPDRNGSSWLYTIEDDYTNVMKNVVNLKPETYRWFNSIEQPKYSKLTIKEGANIVDSKLVGADGRVLEGVDVEPFTINDSEMVACYFDLNCSKRKIGEIVKSIWRSDNLVKRVTEFPNGPTDRYIDGVNKP